MQEVKELFDYFDRDGEGSINIDEFIIAFRVSNISVQRKYCPTARG